MAKTKSSSKSKKTVKTVKTAKSRGRVARPVEGRKILASGKLGAVTKFVSARAAAAKVAPKQNVKTVVSNINHAIRGDYKTAYGYVWNA